MRYTCRLERTTDMELKEYQEVALDAFEHWKEALDDASRECNDLIERSGVGAEHLSDEVRHYPQMAWRKLANSGGVAKSAGDYVKRTDEANRPIPHICFKVPTGGGKTLLAASVLERLNRQTGFTLWIVPTRSIYEQTKIALKNREHPYRQTLERASFGRVKLLEKDDLFTEADVEHYMCIMLLMLPAANRKRRRDFLRIFRDSGRYSSFFPDSDILFGDACLSNEYPDLDLSSGGLVKHSLFNVLKILQPVVVLDEAHKAYGKRKDANEEFVETVNRLNPSLVVELSATPNRGISNLLVDITGTELKKAEMIKVPINITSYTNTEWQYTLTKAQEQLQRLTTEAQSFQMNEGRYIRPIAVVRVERTGKDQRDGNHIHAEDVREYLIQNLGISSEQVVVKSSELDELSNENLLSEFSPIQWVITKSALMEGWDCPFAYILVMLDNTKAQIAITQLVGRVMRQPHVRITNQKSLDQCYVYCHNIEVGTAVKQVKIGLEREGLTGLAGEVAFSDLEIEKVKVVRREPFRDQAIFLPKVLHTSCKGWEELDYQRHILPSVDWDSIEIDPPNYISPNKVRQQKAMVDVGEYEPTYNEKVIYIDKSIQVSWFARRLSDIVPNPWQASRLARQMIYSYPFENIEDRNEAIYDRRSDLSQILRNQISEKLNKQAQEIFVNKLQKKEIRFDLETGQPNYRLVDSFEISISPDEQILHKRYGQSLQLSLFEPVFARDFNKLEQNFARYLDEQKALLWWHRVAEGQKGGDYYLKGWKQGRILPDFIAMSGEEDGKPSMFIYETKGEHMRGSYDTDYKRRVLEALEEAFNYGTMTVRGGPAKGVFRMIFSEEQFSSALAELCDE